MKEDPKERQYLRSLKYLASGFENIIIHEPLPYSEIVKEISHYDLGVYMLRPIDYQTEFALPNKLFEFIQARLGVVVSPQRAMKEFVEENGIGIVTDDFDGESLSKALENLRVEDVLQFKINSHKIASFLCAENFKEHFLNILEEIQR